jgi:branched-chain amino acid transport system substrate-binding protein
VQRFRMTTLLVMAALGSLGSLSVGISSSGASPSKAPLTIALITSETGQAASQSVGSAKGFEARIKAANAAGGVNGHKVVPLVIDDQTSPTEIATAVNEAISKGAVGIVSDSALMFLAAKIAQQAGVPVTGTNSDGPEWGQQPYTNMFASDFGSLDPKYPVSTLQGKLIKEFGGTKAATYGYGISPNSARAVKYDTLSMQKAGIAVPIQDSSVPLGSVDFTAAALSAKQDGVNALFPNLLDSSNYALATAYKQAGIHLKAAVFPVGLNESLVDSPAWPSLQGDYFLSLFRPFSIANAGTRQMQAAMEKYEGLPSSAQVPTYAEYETWLGADLMIQGIAGAGSNPTRAAVIHSLRGIKAYNGNGILPITINYSTVFGHQSPQCVWVFKVGQHNFSLVSSKPTCGQNVPGTSTAG